MAKCYAMILSSSLFERHTGHTAEVDTTTQDSIAQNILDAPLVVLIY